MSFVLTITANNAPGPLYGPYTKNECIQLIYKLLREGTNESGPIEVTYEVKMLISNNHEFVFPGGGGLYLVDSEMLDERDYGEPLFSVVLSNGDSFEFDITDGTIRYIDDAGICQNKWEPGDEEYASYKADYFPELEISEDEDGDVL